MLETDRERITDVSAGCFEVGKEKPGLGGNMSCIGETRDLVTVSWDTVEAVAGWHQSEVEMDIDTRQHGGTSLIMAANYVA